MLIFIIDKIKEFYRGWTIEEIFGDYKITSTIKTIFYVLEFDMRNDLPTKNKYTLEVLMKALFFIIPTIKGTDKNINRLIDVLEQSRNMEISNVDLVHKDRLTFIKITYRVKWKRDYINSKHKSAPKFKHYNIY